jgi:hypothetical protein
MVGSLSGEIEISSLDISKDNPPPPPSKVPTVLNEFHFINDIANQIRLWRIRVKKYITLWFSVILFAKCENIYSCCCYF